MKRHGNLWATLTGFRLETELLRLQDDLTSHAYTPGPYRTFTIHEPKERLISAAPFRDRVAHHALYNVLAPIFEAAFVVLKGAIARKVKDPDVLWLVGRIIDASNPQEPVQEWFRGDDLFGPSLRRRGLPLGNQTSQFFANVYLDAFDHWVCEVLRPEGYVRYVDDFVLFHDDRAWLAEARERCRERLAGLRLRLHPRKVVLSRVEDGTRFLGYRVFPDHRRLPAAGVVRIKRRLRRLAVECAAGRLSVPEVRQRIAAWVGHAGQANTFRLRQRLFSGVKLPWRAVPVLRGGGRKAASGAAAPGTTRAGTAAPPIATGTRPTTATTTSASESR